MHWRKTEEQAKDIDTAEVVSNDTSQIRNAITLQCLTDQYKTLATDSET